jgi:hypothetical protein
MAREATVSTAELGIGPTMTKEGGRKFGLIERFRRARDATGKKPAKTVHGDQQERDPSPLATDVTSGSQSDDAEQCEATASNAPATDDVGVTENPVLSPRTRTRNKAMEKCKQSKKHQQELNNQYKSNSTKPKSQSLLAPSRQPQSPPKHPLPIRQKVRLDQAPTAREAAFGGPPRYDWMDIVSEIIPFCGCACRVRVAEDLV